MKYINRFTMEFKARMQDLRRRRKQNVKLYHNGIIDLLECQARNYSITNDMHFKVAMARFLLEDFKVS